MDPPPSSPGVPGAPGRQGLTGSLLSICVFQRGAQGHPVSTAARAFPAALLPRLPCLPVSPCIPSRPSGLWTHAASLCLPEGPGGNFFGFPFPDCGQTFWLPLHIISRRNYMGFRSTEESKLLISWDLQLHRHLSDPSLSKSLR